MEQFTCNSDAMAAGVEPYTHPLLERAYALMDEFGFPAPAGAERNAIPQAALRGSRGPGARDLAAAFQAYYMFRELHSANNRYPMGFKTLMGDYFFSLLAKLLVTLEDESGLDELFAKRLERDCEADVRGDRDIGLGEYIAFVEAYRGGEPS